MCAKRVVYCKVEEIFSDGSGAFDGVADLLMSIAVERFTRIILSGDWHEDAALLDEAGHSVCMLDNNMQPAVAWDCCESRPDLT